MTHQILPKDEARTIPWRAAQSANRVLVARQPLGVGERIEGPHGPPLRESSHSPPRCVRTDTINPLAGDYQNRQGTP